MQHPADARPCPLLERPSATTRLGYAPAPWVLQQCKETGFVYLENPPGYEALKETFAWESTHQTETTARQQAEPLRYAVSSSIKRFRTRVLKRNKVADLTVREIARAQQGSAATAPRINMVDLGCGTGGMLVTVMGMLPPALQQRCAPHGVEISNALARVADQTLAKAGGRCVHSDAIRGLAQFAPNYFDVIILSSFLEHETQPLPLLRNCHRHLRSGGAVVIKVPNFDSFNRHLRGAKWCGFRWPDHVNYFTPSTLRTMAQQAHLPVARMTLLDRHRFSDSLYAVLRKP